MPRGIRNKQGPEVMSLDQINDGLREVRSQLELAIAKAEETRHEHLACVKKAQEELEAAQEANNEAVLHVAKLQSRLKSLKEVI